MSFLNAPARANNCGDVIIDEESAGDSSDPKSVTRIEKADVKRVFYQAQAEEGAS